MNKEQTFGYRLLTHSMLVGAAFFWGTNPMIMKIGMRELHPVPFNALRLSVGLLAAGILLLLTRSWRPVQRTDLPRFLLVGVAGFFLFQLCYSFGVNYTSASVAAIILGTLPINVALITRLFRIEHLSRRKVLGIAATFLGVILIALGKHGGIGLAGSYVFGVVLLVISEVGYGTYTVFVKPLTLRYSIYQIIFIIMSVSVLLFTAVSLPVFSPSAFIGLKPITWFSAVFSGIFPLAIGNILWSTGVKRIGSTNASVYGNLPPVFGVLAGIIILREVLSPMQLLGALIILGGVALVNKQGTKKPASLRKPEGVSK
ncbi:MAG: DMT family transporter [Spirochaetia bacterium]|nr:DMT family transporter [Spirochaetia bacterium]